MTSLRFMTINDLGGYTNSIIKVLACNHTFLFRSLDFVLPLLMSSMILKYPTALINFVMQLFSPRVSFYLSNYTIVFHYLTISSSNVWLYKSYLTQFPLNFYVKFFKSIYYISHLFPIYVIISLHMSCFRTSQVAFTISQRNYVLAKKTLLCLL